MLNGSRTAVLLDIDRSPEFSGDDADQYSKLISLDKPYDRLVIDIPTIDSATVTVYAQPDDSVLTVPVAIHYRQTSDNATAAMSTTASTGGLRITFDVGLVQFLRLKTSQNQTADRVFYVTGIRS